MIPLKACLFALSTLVAGVSAAHASSFDLQTLEAQAKAEGPITVYASTGKIVEQAKRFSAKYGIQAIGIKAKAPQIIEIMSRESRAHNIKADLAIIADAPAAKAQLIDPGIADSWVPGDMKGEIPARYQDPLTVVLSANVFTYNTGHHRSCPITNIWQLTLPQWRGHVSMQDPVGKPAYTDWFSQMASHYDQQMRDAYQSQFGKPLNTDESSAMAAFVKALAANKPLLTHSDSDAAEAVGSPDAKEDFIGLVSTAKFRKNKDGLKLGLCSGLKPVIGWSNPNLGVIASGSHNQHAAKLFMHYLLTAEGIAPQSIDGKISANSKVKLPADEASGIESYRTQLMDVHVDTTDKDWQQRQDWQDLWSLSYVR